jgi:hypothetical protein
LHPLRVNKRSDTTVNGNNYRCAKSIPLKSYQLSAFSYQLYQLSPARQQRMVKALCGGRQRFPVAQGLWRTLAARPGLS